MVTALLRVPRRRAERFEATEAGEAGARRLLDGRIDLIGEARVLVPLCALSEEAAARLERWRTLSYGGER